ncbi:MAG TPA: sensor histidine kinase, partial [Acidimicrobiales bacterium]|nr:sensor histidine kinase [Acidimicrobiales bacterium]
MSAATTDEGWIDSFEHEAFFYADSDDFLEGTVPFLLEGARNDEAMLVAVPEPRLDALRHELAGATDSVVFVDMGQVGRNPAHIIPAWADFLQANGNGAAPVRGIGEPIWAGRPPDEMIECQRHESLLNVAFAGSGSWKLLCPYDTAALPADVIEEAARSHPWVSGSELGRRRSRDCRDLPTMAAPFEGPLPPAPDDASTFAFDLVNLHLVRRHVAVVAAANGLSMRRVEELVLAAHELASNSVRHAGGRGVLRMWNDAWTVVCEVSDCGRIEHA